MPDDSNDETATRRAYLSYGGAVVGGLLAGCTGRSDDGATPTATDSQTEGDTTTETAAPDRSYSATLSPVDTVEFDSVPSNVAVYSLLYADMVTAYGHGDAVNSLGFDAAAGGDTLDAYYERLDGVAFDSDGLAQLNGGSGEIRVDKELLYELDSDLHLLDPALLQSFDGWGRDDVDEIATNVAPFFGNTYSRTHGQPPEGWRDGYDYYTLWELAERVADVFRVRERYERLAAVHTDLVSEVTAGLPPESERPSVASVIFVDGTFYPSKLNAPGFGNAHTRPLGAVDVFAGTDAGFDTTYDYETLLELDPDVILHQFGIASYYDVAAIRDTVADDPVGGRLRAIQNDRLYPSGNPVQGPLMNLFQLEATAKQLYPDQFGPWPAYEPGDPYPEFDPDEQLFDRERVADAVGGGR